MTSASHYDILQYRTEEESLAFYGARASVVPRRTSWGGGAGWGLVMPLTEGESQVQFERSSKINYVIQSGTQAYASLRLQSHLPLTKAVPPSSQTLLSLQNSQPMFYYKIQNCYSSVIVVHV